MTEHVVNKITDLDFLGIGVSCNCGRAAIGPNRELAKQRLAMLHPQDVHVSYEN